MHHGRLFLITISRRRSNQERERKCGKWEVGQETGPYTRGEYESDKKAERRNEADEREKREEGWRDKMKKERIPQGANLGLLERLWKLNPGHPVFKEE